MGYFGTVDQREFDEFKVLVNRTLAELERQIAEKATDSEELAKSAAQNADAIRKRLTSIESDAAELLRELNTCKVEASKEVEAIRKEKENTDATNGRLASQLESTANLYHELNQAKVRIEEAERDVSAKIELLLSYLKKGEALPANVEATTRLVKECEDSIEAITGLFEHARSRKKDIDTLYREIYGEDHKDEEGAVEHVDGIKDHLERSYRNVAQRIQELDAEISKTTGSITDKHNALLDDQIAQFKQLIGDSNQQVTAVEAQLTSLLPGAMAEGLSAAFERKKEEEIKSLHRFERSFRYAIYGMIAVSMIPLGLDLYLVLIRQNELLQVVKETPGIMAAVLPLYFPILWMAHTSNKKCNLSKRLIEEYTHKAVLGKTFSGLSNQIDGLKHDPAKEDLRNRLLYSVLQVSAENPGKLITDYQKSDHPLMDVLENSTKLADSVAKLSKIPGFSSIARRITEKNEKRLRETDGKVESGLEEQEQIENVAIGGGRT